MKLSDYLETEYAGRDKDFADEIDILATSLSRYKMGIREPSREVMKRIMHVTKGKVTPNDFYS
jgi:DNA-binding transcriptional regulator YdaS (Cro superfamily)